MKGSVYKRCGCTIVDERGKRKQLGRSCPKLKRPDGAWNPRHGTWYYSLTVVGLGGKRKPVVRGGYESSTEAQAALDKVKGKIASGLVVNDRLTVADYLRTWIEGKSDLKVKARSSYRGHIERVWVPHIGHLRLADLRVGHVKAVFAAIEVRNDQIRVGKLRGARITGPASQHRIRATLSSALNDARREGLITINVAALVRLPSGKRPKALVWTVERETRWRAEVDGLIESGHSRHVAYSLAERPSAVMVWRPDHLGIFLDYVADDRLYALWHLKSHRGTRRGETCGLEWPDFDGQRGSLSIERQIVRGDPDGALIEDTPKSDSGVRTIALGTDGVAELNAHRKRQLAERLAWGEAWIDSGKIFTRENGSVIDPRSLTEEFNRKCEECDLPPIRLHDLRHVAASLMLAAGVDLKVVQETLGHSDLSMTADTYTSVYPDVAADAANRAAAIVPRRGRVA